MVLLVGRWQAGWSLLGWARHWFSAMGAAAATRQIMKPESLSPLSSIRRPAAGLDSQCPAARPCDVRRWRRFQRSPGQDVGGESHGFGMEVAARKSRRRLSNTSGIVRGCGGYRTTNTRAAWLNCPRQAPAMRHAADGIGVLHASAIGVRGVDGAAVQQRTHGGRPRAICPLFSGACRVDARIEGRWNPGGFQRRQPAPRPAASTLSAWNRPASANLVDHRFHWATPALPPGPSTRLQTDMLWLTGPETSLQILACPRRSAHRPGATAAA